MKFIAIASLLTLATAAPCHTPDAKVALRIVTPTRAYHPSSDMQQSLQVSTEIVQVLVGQTLSMDHAPLRMQAIKIAEITKGKDLSPSARTVAQDDWRVVCKAKIGYGSKGWVFGVEDGSVSLNNGEPVDVTGLECWLEGDDGLVGGF